MGITQVHVRILVLGLTALVGAVGGLVLLQSRPDTVVSAATVARPEGLVAPDVVVSKVRGMTAIAQRIDRLEVKLSTFGAVMAVAAPGGWVQEPSPETLVWVVATNGLVEPSAARGAKYPWGVFVYNAATGQIAAEFANDKTNWPPFFDALADLSKQ